MSSRVSSILQPTRSYDAKIVKTSFSDEIGHGSYGKVHKVYHSKLGCAAAKIFIVTGTMDRHSDVYRLVEKEAEVMALINHENIVRFHGVSCWSHFFALIMDYQPGGSLHTLLENSLVTEIPWKLRLRLVLETIKAITYLQHSGVEDHKVHGDLKTTNILLTEYLHVKVADCGAAMLAAKTCDRSSFEPHQLSRLHTVVFSAPEFLRNVFTEKHPSMDLFSLGRVIYQVVTREVPYKRQNCQNITDAILNGALPSEDSIPLIRDELVETASDDLRIFDVFVNTMHQCCDECPENRPTISHVQDRVLALMRQTSSVLISRAVHFVMNQMHIRYNEIPPSGLKSLYEYVR